jgi:hypothetical protein
MNLLCYSVLFRPVIRGVPGQPTQGHSHLKRHENVLANHKKGTLGSLRPRRQWCFWTGGPSFPQENGRQQSTMYSWEIPLTWIQRESLKLSWRTGHWWADCAGDLESHRMTDRGLTGDLSNCSLSSWGERGQSRTGACPRGPS